MSISENETYYPVDSMYFVLIDVRWEFRKGTGQSKFGQTFIIGGHQKSIQLQRYAELVQNMKGRRTFDKRGNYGKFLYLLAET